MTKHIKASIPILISLIVLVILLHPFAAEASGSMTPLTPSDIQLTGWAKDKNGVQYYGKSHKPVVGFQKISSKWYYFDKKGYLRTGWVKTNGKWRYMKSNGVMARKQWVNWQGKQYYIGADAYMATGWKKKDGSWYYFHNDGTKASNEYIGGRYLDKNGRLTGTKKQAMRWKKHNGDVQYVDRSGSCIRSQRLWIGNACYHFNKDGFPVKNKTVQGRTYNSKGKWVTDGKIRTKNGSAKKSTRITKMKNVRSLDELIPKIPNWADVSLISHAAGGIDEYTYTNSREALLSSIANGYQAIELDFRYTKDHHLVCTHYWSNVGLSETPTLKEFLSTKIEGRYTTMTAETALTELVNAKTIYLVVDVKESDENELVNAYTDIRNILMNIEGGQRYMEMVVPQIYNEAQYAKLQKVYSYKNWIFTLYRLHPKTDVEFETIADFCKNKRIDTVTMPTSYINQTRINYFLKRKVLVATHTINDIKEKQAYLDMGISTIYTDFLK